MRTRESAQLHTRHDGQRAILHEYLDPYFGKPIPIGGSILLAGVRYRTDLQAPTAIVSAVSFEYLLTLSNQKGTPPYLPGTNIPVQFACVVGPDGTYARSDGTIKDVVWFNQQLAIEAPQLTNEDSIPQAARDWVYPPPFEPDYDTAPPPPSPRAVEVVSRWSSPRLTL